MWKTQLGRWRLDIKHNTEDVVTKAAARYQDYLHKSVMSSSLFDPQGHKAVNERDRLR